MILVSPSKSLYKDVLSIIISLIVASLLSTIGVKIVCCDGKLPISTLSSIGLYEIIYNTPWCSFIPTGTKPLLKAPFLNP